MSGKPTKFVCLLLLINILNAASGLKASVMCSQENIQNNFTDIFSMSILLNKTTIAVIDSKEVIQSSAVALDHVSGSLSRDRVYISVELDVECPMINAIQCQVFGLPNNMENFTYEFISADITFKGSMTNLTSNKTPDLDLYATGDKVDIQCSADVGSPHEEWYFSVVDDEKNKYTNDALITSSVTRSGCVFHASATFSYIINISGRLHLQCNYGNTTVGSFVVDVINLDDNLSFHLHLSSMILVYCPFVIMPSLWCSCQVCSKKWRNPENKRFKLWRSVISLFDWILFSAWWIWTYYKYQGRKEIISYVTFAVIEDIFILGYAIYRCLFPYLEKEGNWFGDQRAFVSRITTSHGVVMTPIICWLMIRVPNNLPFYPIEVFFWIISFLSTLVFVFVSHQRESHDWMKKRK